MAAVGDCTGLYVGRGRWRTSGRAQSVCSRAAPQTWIPCAVTGTGGHVSVERARACLQTRRQSVREGTWDPPKRRSRGPGGSSAHGYNLPEAH